MKYKIVIGIFVLLVLVNTIYLIYNLQKKPANIKEVPAIISPIVNIPTVPITKPVKPPEVAPRIETSQKAAALKKIINDKIVNVDAYFNLGNTYYSLGRYAEAEEAYKKVLAVKPKDYQAYNSIGNCHNAMGSYAKAIEAYKTSIDLKSDNFKAYNNMGNTYRNMNDNEQALTAYKKALELKPNSPDVYYNIGVTYGLLGQKEQARAMLTKAKELYQGRNNEAGAKRVERSLQNL